MRALVLALVSAACACDGRAIGVNGDAQVPASDAAAAVADLSSGGFCASGPRVMIDGAELPVSRVESGPIYMGCCDGWFARFVARQSSGQEVRVTFSFRWAGGQPPPSPHHFDLSSPQGTDGMGVYVECDPSAACGSLSPYDAAFSGTLDTTPTSAFPGYHIDLCLSASPTSVADPSARPVRLSARQQLIILTNPQCDWGKDQTCNHDPWVSSIKGTCNGDGTCTCLEGAEKDPATGRCK